MLKKAFFTNSSGILCSRVLGFLRDLSMANVLGAGVYSDIFFAAFKFPNLFRRIFGEGAFTQSFLPHFIASSKKAAFSVLVLAIFSCVLLLLSLFVLSCSGVVTKLLAWGFSDSVLEMTKPIVVINFWYLLLVFLVTFCSSLLQYKHHFWVSAYNTALLNCAMIAALLLAREKDSLDIVYYVSYGVLVGGVLQIIIHLYPLYRLGFYRMFICGVKEIRLCFTPTQKARILAHHIKHDLAQFFRRFFPALLGSSTAQIASFIDTMLASFLASGSISYLYYANRIFQLPLAIFAIALSTALFPTIAKLIKAQQEEQALIMMKNTFWFLFIMLLLCVVGGVMLREQIIFLLYEHGKFLREDTEQTALVFGAYMLGLLPFGLARIFSLYLYSHMKQALAAKISAISLGVGVLGSLVLMFPLGAVGLALAGSMSGVVLFWLSVRAFGVDRFWYIMNEKRYMIMAIMAVIIEVLVLLVWLHYVQI